MSAHVQDDKAVTGSAQQEQPSGPAPFPARGSARRNRRLGLLVAVSLAVAWGLAAGWWTPRG